MLFCLLPFICDVVMTVIPLYNYCHIDRVCRSIILLVYRNISQHLFYYSINVFNVFPAILYHKNH